MSVEKIEKLAEVFVKLALSKSTAAKVAPIEARMKQIAEQAADPASAEATEFQKLTKQYKDIIASMARHLPPGEDPDTSNYPAAREWRELKKRLARLTSATKGTYRSKADVARDNRQIMNILDRAAGSAGGDRGPTQNIDNAARKAQLGKGTFKVNFVVAPKRATTVQAIGGDANLQNYARSQLAATARWVDKAMANNTETKVVDGKQVKVKKPLVPTTTFPYEIGKFPY